MAYAGGLTSSMLKHLTKKHPMAGQSGSSTCSTAEGSRQKQSTLSGFFGKRECNPMKSEKISSLLAEMVAIDCLPISVVEGKGLRKLLNFIEPGYTIPSRKAISSRIKILFDARKDEMKSLLREAKHVCLTTDCWTSRSQEGFMPFFGPPVVV